MQGADDLACGRVKFNCGGPCPGGHGHGRMDSQPVARIDLEQIVRLQRGAALGTGRCAHRVAKVRLAGGDVDGLGGPGSVHHVKGVAHGDFHIPGRAQIAAQLGANGGGDANFWRGRAHQIAAVDGAIDHQVASLDIQLARSRDPATGAIQGQGAQVRAQGDGLARQRGLHRAIQEDVVGTAQKNGTRGALGQHFGGVVQHQAVEAIECLVVANQASGFNQAAIAAFENHLVICLNQALNGQRAARADVDIAARATGDDIALQQATLTGVERDRARQGFQHAGGIEVDVSPVRRNAAVQMNGRVRAHFACDVKLAIGALWAADGDGRARVGRVERIAPSRQQFGGHAKVQAQIGLVRADFRCVCHAGFDQSQVVGACQADMAVAQLGFDIRVSRCRSKVGVAGTDRWGSGRAIALNDLPRCIDHRSVQI